MNRLSTQHGISLMQNHFKRFLLLSVSVMLGITLTAQTEVGIYQPGITESGITYFLPITQIRLVVTATKTHHAPGEFCEYAERYLRLKNVAQTDYDEWKIDNIELFSYGVADKTKAYSIKLKPKTSAPLVEMTADGRLLSINAKAIYSDDVLPTSKVTRNAKKHVDGNDFKTAEILSAGSITKMAELTANEIYDIRENRTLLTKGQADFMPKDGEQLRLMLESLNTQEEGLLQLFQGTTSEETHVFTFDITPTNDVDKLFVFNFSKYLGMIDEDDPAGQPFYMSITDLKTLPPIVENPNDKKKAKEPEDVRYNIPSRAKVRVFTDEKDYASTTFQLAQFGRVEHLGGDLFNKKFTTHVYLSPVTGNIVKIDAARPE